MKKMERLCLMLVFALSFSFILPSILIAAEHGGSAMGEHGGTTMPAQPAAQTKGATNAATIREAATLLTATHPDLAGKLEKIAAEEEKE